MPQQQPRLITPGWLRIALILLLFPGLNNSFGKIRAGKMESR